MARLPRSGHRHPTFRLVVGGGCSLVVGDWWLVAVSYQPPVTNHQPPSRITLNDLIPLRADAHVRDRRLDDLLHPIEIAAGRTGEILVPAGGGGVLGPALPPPVTRADPPLRREVRRASAVCWRQPSIHS